MARATQWDFSIAIETMDNVDGTSVISVVQNENNGFGAMYRDFPCRPHDFDINVNRTP